MLFHALLVYVVVVYVAHKTIGFYRHKNELTSVAALGMRIEGRSIRRRQKRRLFNTTIVEHILFSFLKARRTGLSKPVITMASTERI